MRVKFHQSLDDLKEKLLVMAGMAEQAIQRSIEAYRTRDLSICELVFRAEPSINRLEREIDQMALISDWELYLAITSGGASVEVSAVMPAWSSALKEQEIRDVAAYVKTFAQPKKGTNP